MIYLAALSRIVPHPPDFTVVGSMALFAGVCLTDLRVALVSRAARWCSGKVLPESGGSSFCVGCVVVRSGRCGTSSASWRNWGHLGRKGDGEPDWITIGRGVEKRLLCLRGHDVDEIWGVLKGEPRAPVNGAFDVRRHLR